MSRIAHWIASIPTLGISVNKMYASTSHGPRLTNDGRQHKSEITAAVAQQLPLDWGRVIDSVYTDPCYVCLDLTLRSPKFENGSWKPGARTESGARSSPYQKMDASNYIKLIEDGIVGATGIDDCLHLEVAVRRVFSLQAGIDVIYEVYEDHHYGNRTHRHP